MSNVFTRSLMIALALLTVGCNDRTSSDQTEADVEAVPAESESVIRPPIARVETVSDQYHGIEVKDPYRWLETWDNQEVKDWSEGQNA